LLCFFFFSSRRRHTRFSRDWSSDVCSSDLGRAHDEPGSHPGCTRTAEAGGRGLDPAGPRLAKQSAALGTGQPGKWFLVAERGPKIGRASCRERAESWGAGVSEKRSEREEAR